MFVQRRFSMRCGRGSLLCLFHSGYFCFNKNDFSSFILISSVCYSEIIVLNLRARLYGMFCFVCLGWWQEELAVYLFIIDICFELTFFVPDHYV